MTSAALTERSPVSVHRSLLRYHAAPILQCYQHFRRLPILSVRKYLACLDVCGNFFHWVRLAFVYPAGRVSVSPSQYTNRIHLGAAAGRNTTAHRLSYPNFRSVDGCFPACQAHRINLTVTMGYLPSTPPFLHTSENDWHHCPRKSRGICGFCCCSWRCHRHECLPNFVPGMAAIQRELLQSYLSV